MPATWRVAATCLLVTSLAAAAALNGVRAADSSVLSQLPQTWRDDRGREIRLAGLAGRSVVVTMAYASCRRVCPGTIAHLQRLQSEMDADGKPAEFVIVGYDPSVDDPQAWRRYRESRGLTRENWHFLTGTPASTEQLARRLGFRFWKYDRHVLHDYRIVVLDEHGALRAEYGPES
jgi:cytochrome oxidase Cu insertion factor (SCO1/SenC/PrrC family)